MNDASVRVDWLVRPGGPMRGTITVPGDKSISHRAVMLASIADGSSRIDNFLEGADTRATAAICSQLGVRIEGAARGERIVHGVGREGLQPPSSTLDCGNAGTAMRLLCGLLAGQDFDSELVGDASLSQRPMARVINPLRSMGAHIEAQRGGLPPLQIGGGRSLAGVDYQTPIASAQVKSAVLLAGLYAAGTTLVRETPPTRGYTESLLKHFGYPIDYAEGVASLRGGGRLHARDLRVPGDFSSAAFWLVGALLVEGSALCVDEVGFNPRRNGLWRTLESMGAKLGVTSLGSEIEPTARLEVRASRLHGIAVPPRDVPDMIDEMPALFVAAALADGETLIEGAGELRVKESDRIRVMSAALAAMGADIQELADGARIRGVHSLRSAEVDAAGDHRCAMALAIAALRANGEVRIRDCANVATSYPDFEDQLRRLGITVVSTLADRQATFE